MTSRMREQKTIVPQICSEPILRAIVGGMKTQSKMRQFNVLLARILLCTQQKTVLLGTIN